MNKLFKIYKELPLSTDGDKIVIMVYGMFCGSLIGWTLGSFNYLGLFKLNFWRNGYINAKRLLYNYNTKTFYMTNDINSQLIDDFKNFMFSVGPTQPIDIVLETHGGSFSGAQMISDIIVSHGGISNAIVLNKAFSAGTLIALSCTNLYMHRNAHLSPVDVQQGNFFSTVQLSAVKTIIDKKNADRVNDDTFLMADQAEKCNLLITNIFNKIIKPRYDADISLKIKSELFDGDKYIHSTTFSVSDLRNMGINVQDITKNMISKANCKKQVYDVHNCMSVC